MAVFAQTGAQRARNGRAPARRRYDFDAIVTGTARELAQRVASQTRIANAPRESPLLPAENRPPPSKTTVPQGAPQQERCSSQPAVFPRENERSLNSGHFRQQLLDRARIQPERDDQSTQLPLKMRLTNSPPFPPRTCRATLSIRLKFRIINSAAVSGRRCRTSPGSNPTSLSLGNMQAGCRI